MNKLKWKSKQSIHKVHKKPDQPRETPGIKWDRKRKKQKSKNEQIKMEKQTIKSRFKGKENILIGMKSTSQFSKTICC